MTAVLEQPVVAWEDANEAFFRAELDRLKAAIRVALGRLPDSAADEAEGAVDAVRGVLPSAPAIDLVAEAFRLSQFERSLLLMAAGVELDGELAELRGSDRQAPISRSDLRSREVRAAGCRLEGHGANKVRYAVGGSSSSSLVRRSHSPRSEPRSEFSITCSASRAWTSGSSRSSRCIHPRHWSRKLTWKRPLR